MDSGIQHRREEPGQLDWHSEGVPGFVRVLSKSRGFQGSAGKWWVVGAVVVVGW